LINACKILIGKPEGKSPLGRHRLRCDMGCIWLRQERDRWRALVNKLNEPSGTLKGVYLDSYHYYNYFSVSLTAEVLNRR
jgi:hypothetical protein